MELGPGLGTRAAAACWRLPAGQRLGVLVCEAVRNTPAPAPTAGREAGDRTLLGSPDSDPPAAFGASKAARFLHPRALRARLPSYLSTGNPDLTRATPTALHRASPHGEWGEWGESAKI